MRLSILVPCLLTRPYGALVEKLTVQSLGRPVEVLTSADGGERTSGHKRQTLLERSRGEYICYVDDDDDVSDDYVACLMSGISHDTDVVTFDVYVDLDGVRVEHWSLYLGPDNRQKGLMTANHLCAWRREIAGKVAWHPDLGYGDDQMWYKPLLMAGLAKTESHVHKEIYKYIFRSSSTVNQRRSIIRYSRRLIGDGMRVYRADDGEIFLECAKGGDGERVVRDRFNIRHVKSVNDLTLIGVAQIV